MVDDNRVRSWPFVSLNIRRAHLDDWTELARLSGRSRADLMREALEQVGLPYARSVARAGSGRVTAESVVVHPSPNPPPGGDGQSSRPVAAGLSADAAS
jgi:hypothetical protein